MAHFAKLGINSKVINVEVVNDNDCKNADGAEDESVGIQFLERVHGWPLWKQTSYNTKENKHYAFIPPKPFASWVLNETTCVYEAPVAFPTVTEYGDPVKFYFIVWDEANGRWIATDQESPVGNHRWDATAKAWVAL